MRKSILITGGAGFIGANSVARFAHNGWDVVALDNLSRNGSRLNLAWLRANVDFRFIEGDLRHPESLAKVFRDNSFSAILHLAGQTAVTASVTDPRWDFENNAVGTFNLLEATRVHARDAVFIFASTNKVYGKMDGIRIEEREGRYAYADLPLGASEETPLSFHSPYGCSKGAADQYVIDYSRIYGMRSVSFRQSCIYGPRQFGVEDQGWLAWFSIAAILGRPVTIYGDGKQIRDVLHVDDLIRAYELAVLHPDRIAGEAFNVGGGPENILSLLDLIGIIEAETGADLNPRFDAWRPGDQLAFVSDTRKLQERLGWHAETGACEGVRHLIRWIQANRKEIASLFPERVAAASGSYTARSAAG